MKIGKYETLDLLGKGGFGEVWRARDTSLGRVVALKIMRGLDDEGRVRFHREARLAARLSHPHIAQVFEAGDDPPHLAMQFVDGVPLLHDALPVPKRLAALAAAARAVHHAHESGILHRDLKPPNVLVREDGHAFVVDFGLAREVQGGDSRLSLTGDILGTPSFMAPEQARGDVHALDARTDVYGLGATLYAVLTGGPPHAGPSPYEVVRRVIEEDPAPPPPAHRDAGTICLKALEKIPARRYATALEFAEDLERALRGEPVLARLLSPPARILRRIRRRPALWALSALTGAALIAAVGVGSVSVWRRQSELAATAAAHRERADRERDAVAAADARARQAESQALIDEARASLADVRTALYMGGSTLAAFAGDLDRVRDLCARALELDPGSAAAWFWIGEAAAVAARPDEAIEAYRRAVEVADAPGYCWAALGRALLDRGNQRTRYEGRPAALRRAQMEDAVREAAECFAHAGDPGTDVESAVAEAYRLYWLVLAPGEMERWVRDSLARLGRVPGTEEFDILLADSLVKLGNRRAAIASYTRAIEACPGHFLAHLQRGGQRHLAGDRRGAAEDWTRAAEIQPLSAEPFYNLAVLRHEGGDAAGAIEIYDRALELDPDFLEAHFNRAVAKQDLGEYDQAVAGFDRVLELSPGWPDALLSRGQARFDSGNTPGALADWDEALRIDPDYLPAYVNRGTARTELRDLEGAIQDFGEALRVDPDDPDALGGRAWAFLQAGDAASACEDLRHALRAAPRDWPNRPLAEQLLQDAQAALEQQP